MGNENKVAIIGMAGRFPGAKTLKEFWSNLENGVESLSDFTDEDLLASGIPESRINDENLVKKGFVLDDIDKFDAKFFNCSPSEARMMDPQIRFFLECAWEVLENSGYDPDRYTGKIGVFSGMGMNSYIFNFAKNRSTIKSGEAFQTKILNDKDFLSTWASYKLNLTGPSVSIQTACSTSLVAVHMAVQSLLNGECDIAIAGAVSIGVPQKLGHYYYKGGIESIDGHCRAFDADGRGTMNSSGLGLVALQRLDDAIANRNSIDAVILGSAINNDGTMKMSYTAPSIQGQSEVIAEALAIADVPADSITYVEAHGTGTPIGDPAEVAALSEAFGAFTDKKRFCGIGSVKTNIGHLDTAAGIAGLIKTVLAMKNKKIPASLHFKKPNPEIDFENSPFYVNAELKDWNQHGPLRAGVSSFGIGGTNAHLILESYPETFSSEESDSWKVMTLSAKTESALNKIAINLADYLESSPGVNLTDVVHTLQIGRKEFEHRRVVVCQKREQAIDMLRAKAERVLTDNHDRSERRLVFMFPGQGSQYPQMAKDLYQQESVFKKELDRCFSIVSTVANIDLKSALFSVSDTEDASALINQTHYTQPLIFSVEYALAKLLIHWGFQPKAMIGHSIGEYVAACISGVFTLEDALLLVSARGALIRELPAGKMLAVRQSREELKSILPGDYDFAAINSPKSCVISGEGALIDSIYQQLDKRGIKSQLLRTSHAFHSEMMNPILDAFKAKVKAISLNTPQIPYVSNVTGEWIQAEQAISPDYWVNHLRGAVLFSKGIETLVNNSTNVFLEVGPGQALLGMVNEHDIGDLCRAIPTIRHRENNCNDSEFLARSIGRIWLSGVKINWDKFHNNSPRRRVHLPSYPLQPERYWIDAQKQVADVDSTLSSSIICSTDTKNFHPRPELDDDFEAPRNSLERELVLLWERSFEIDRIGVLDNFFELGGNSLQALLLIDLIIDKFDVDVTLSRLFMNPTVRLLAEDIAKEFPSLAEEVVPEKRKVSRSSMDRIIPDLKNRHEPFPLNDIQHAYWLGRTGVFSLGENSTHIYLEIEIYSGEIAAFNKAWNKLVNRHDMLRAVVLSSGEQKILETVPEYTFEVLDVVDKSPDDIRLLQENIRKEMSHNVISLEQWPLFEIRAIRSKPEGFRLCFSIDILIADAWSINMLIEQWLMFYQNPELELPKLDLSFRDYVIAEEKIKDSEIFHKCRNYWFDRIDGLPPSPQLPLALSPEKVTNPEFKRRTYQLEADKWNAIKNKAIKLGVTPSAVLMGIFSEILALWSRSPHFTINLTLYNRHPAHEQVNEIVGDFTSLTLLEINNAETSTITGRIKQIQQQLWEDLDNRFCGAISVLREMTRRHGSQVSMPVVFTSTLGVRSLKHENSNSKAIGEEGYGISQTTQVWLDHQVMEWNGMLRFNWDTVESLFPNGLLDSMFESYCKILTRLTADEKLWDMDIAPLLLPDDQAKALKLVNQTMKPLDEDLLQTLFEKQVSINPDQIAVVSSEKSFTYRQLYNRSVSLAVELREKGCRPNHLVAVVMDKSVYQVVAVMGILFAGSAYLPIDPGIPQDRLHYLLKNSNASVALTVSALAEKLVFPPDVQVICIDGLPEPEVPPQKLEPLQKFDDLAYVLYTSGSTGVPKGVMIPHRGAVNTILDINRRYSLGSGDRVIGLSALNFDLSVYDLFGTLSSGATLVIPDAGTSRNPAHWVNLIKQHNITFWNTVPALMQILVDYIEDNPEENFDELRLAMMSGDWIPPKLPERMLKLWPGVQVISAGGPTECSIWSATHIIDPQDCQLDSIPYGTALNNQEIHILNHALQTCPMWVPGELYIAGDGLAKGYLNDPEKTNSLFIEHPLTKQRLYKSGDLGRYLPNGNIEFLGRNDFQVNINGNRVELGEIESVLKEQVGIKEAVVVALGNQDSKNKTKLIAYVVQEEGFTDITTNKIELTNFKISQPGLRQSKSNERTIILPPPQLDKSTFIRRQSYRQYLKDEISRTDFNGLISTLSQLKLDDEPLPKHLYPSAGSLHAVRIYLHVKAGRIEGIEGGIYYYHPADHALVEVNNEDAINRGCYGVGENPYMYDDAAFSLFMVGDLNVIATIYGAEKAKEFAFIEAGYIGQILMEKAPLNLIGLAPVGYLSQRASEALRLDEGQVVIHSMVGGRINPQRTEKWIQDGPLSLPDKQNSRDSDEIQQVLRQRLPEYMVPSVFVPIKAIPLTTNGKVDRKSLAAIDLPEIEEKRHVLPSNEVEKKIVDLWKEYLHVENISVYDNFFELGGDSILIVRVHKKLSTLFDKKISIIDMFKYTTIHELASFIGISQKILKEDSGIDERMQKKKSALIKQRKLIGEKA